MMLKIMHQTPQKENTPYYPPQKRYPKTILQNQLTSSHQIKNTKKFRLQRSPNLLRSRVMIPLQGQGEGTQSIDGHTTVVNATTLIFTADEERASRAGSASSNQTLPPLTKSAPELRQPSDTKHVAPLDTKSEENIPLSRSKELPSPDAPATIDKKVPKNLPKTNPPHTKSNKLSKVAPQSKKEASFPSATVLPAPTKPVVKEEPNVKLTNKNNDYYEEEAPTTDVSKSAYRPTDDKRPPINQETVKDNNFWGFTSTRHIAQKPEIRVPRVYSLDLASNPKAKETLIEESEDVVTTVVPEASLHSHTIPDPYNTVPLPDAMSKDVVKNMIDEKEKGDEGEESLVKMPIKATPYTKEPPHGLRTLFPPNLAKAVAKNQSQVQQLKVDSVVNKAARVEYEIYQDDYRNPKYRFFKKYKEKVTAEDVKEKENWVPWANCFDNKKQEKKFHIDKKLGALEEVQEFRKAKKQEQIDQYGKGPIFNRIVSCLCGEDNEAGYQVPGYKPPELEEDEDDLQHFMEAPHYKEKRRSY
ncbi:uncharacterized protein LOC118434378 [Folsomia candida]|uniref:uncharacterized protein LOC118434378 n=1 Tax=Folsomia candida TaxID=158441 RepID=UPI001604A98D|nr:uncharacterized protein LOC118434378 [Folsomia candida]